MRSLSLGAGERLQRVLAIGCHADDVEIGCGGTLLALVRSTPGLRVTWVVLAADGARGDEARASAAAFLGGALAQVEVFGHRDGFLPYHGADVKDAFEGLKAVVDPDLVLTHTRDDAHQDHRLACELTWNTFRDHLILEYEVPKWDGDLGRPNVYMPLDDEVVDAKIDLLMRHFPSQAAKHWYDAETFRGLMRLRGVECAARYAEAFRGPKLAVTV